MPVLQTVWVAKDVTSGRYKPHKLKGEEVAVVDQVSRQGDWRRRGMTQLACWKCTVLH
jgi:hypothetical protein